MAKQVKKKPEAVFEVVFDGPDIFPEAIPLGTLTQTLSAVRRLAAGTDAPEEDEDAEAPDDQSIRLLDVVRGSAVFRFVGPAALIALANLRGTGEILQNPEAIGDKDYILNPVAKLSATAKRIGCPIVVREPGKDGTVLARIEPSTYETISDRLFVKGETEFTGRVERVGGATQVRCGLRVHFQTRMLICMVASREVARELGDCLYRNVSVKGDALWVKHTWRVVDFTIKSVVRLNPGKLTEAFQALRDAGGKGWDNIPDPRAYLEEVSGP
jgi:hypothetical protein